MKKHAFINLLKTAALFAFVAATMGCSGLADINNKTDGAKETASIEIQIGSAARYAITPYYEYIDQMAKIVFSGKQTDGEATYEKTWNGESIPDPNGSGREEWISAYQKLQEDPIVKDIQLGKWEFTLECYNKDGALICSGKTKKTLKPGNNGAIVIELENVQGNGGVNIELCLDYLPNLASLSLRKTYDGDIKTTDQNGETTTKQNTGNGVYSIKASLKKLDGTVVEKTGTLTLEIVTTTNDNYSVFYSKEEIPAGSYILSFMVYEKKDAATAESLLTTVSELVNVAPWITTNNGSLALASLNKSYPINYAQGLFYYSDQEVSSYEGRDFDMSWIVGNVPLTYTEYDTITLPTVYDVLKPCDEYKTYDNIMYYTSYIFDGWYLDKDFRQPIEKIIGSELSGNVSLYAKFEQFNIAYNTSAFKGVNDDKGEITVKFSTSATIPEDWFKQIEFSWKNGGIVSLGNTEPEFEYLYERGSTTGIFTFKNAHVLEFGSDTFIASIKGVPIAKEEVNTAVLTSDVINAFYPDAENTTEIILPSGYTSMGVYLFCDDSRQNKYTNLETVNIPEDYTSIGAYAFANCDTITTVNIPDTVTWIGYFAFGGNSSKGCAFGSITIPASVESIDNYAFNGCKNLKTVVMEGTTPPTLGSSVFEDNIVNDIYVPYKAINAYEDKCSKNKDGWNTSYQDKLKPYLSQTDVKSLGYDKEEYIVLPETISLIAKNAFEGCTKLKGIVLPENLWHIESGAFADCANLQSVTFTSNDVPAIAPDVFGSNLNAIYVPDGAVSNYQVNWQNYTSIITSSTLVAALLPQDVYGSYNIPFGYRVIDTEEGFKLVAFTPVNGKATVIIPESVVEIKAEAFKNCSITEITIPENVTFIGVNAFSDCNYLKYVYMLPKTPPALGNDAFRKTGGDPLTSLKAIYVPVGSDGTETYFEKYYEDSYWNTHTDKLQVLLTNAELQDYPSDTEFIDLQQTTYTVIASGAFAGFTKLSSVILPPSRSDRLQIKAGAFKGCDSLGAIQFTSTDTMSFNYEGVTYTIDIDDNSPSSKANFAKWLTGKENYTFTDTNSQEVSIDLSEYDLFR